MLYAYNVQVAEVRYAMYVRCTLIQRLGFAPEATFPINARIDGRTGTVLVLDPVFSCSVFDDPFGLGHSVSANPPAPKHNTLVTEDLLSPCPSLPPELLSLVDVLSVGSLTLAASVQAQCTACVRAVQLLALNCCGERS